jgi:hypothetical protein
MLPSAATYDSYGGEKADYSPVEDTTTDRSADHEDEAFADVAAMTRMIPRAYVAFTTNGTTCSVVDHDAVWGNDVSVRPTVVRTALGIYTITWPSAVTDARGASRSINLRRGLANVEDQASAAFANAIRLGPNSFKVATQTVALSGPDDLIGEVITATVW